MAKIKLYDIPLNTQEEVKQAIKDIQDALKKISPTYASYDLHIKKYAEELTDIIDNYIDEDYVIETHNGDLYDAILEAIYEISGGKFDHYYDAYEYLQEEGIDDFQEALAEGYGSNICSIARYYYREGLLKAFGQVVDTTFYKNLFNY